MMSYPIFEPTQHDNFKINIVHDYNDNGGVGMTMTTPPSRSPARRSTSSTTMKRISYDNLYASDWSPSTNNSATTTNGEQGGTGAQGGGGEDLFALLATKTDFDTPAANRDPRAGAWTFDPNAEYDLLIHVQGLLQAQQQQQPGSGNPIETAEAILRAIDVYCLGKQWMYHIGASKGQVISNFLQHCLQQQQQQQLTIVDMGTYCGYSAIVLAKTVLKHNPKLPFKVYSLETNPKFAMVAKTMITMAQMDSYVEVITYNPNESSLALSKTLQQSIIVPATRQKKKIDFLLLDHDKDRYLPDLKQLETQQWITSGSYVAADNVVVAPQLQEYRRYLAHKQATSHGKVLQTRMIEQQLEYSDKNDLSLRDGIELTVYS